MYSGRTYFIMILFSLVGNVVGGGFAPFSYDDITNFTPPSTPKIPASAGQ